MSSLHLNTRGYDWRHKVINFILFIIIILLFALVVYEILQIKNENEDYKKEIQTLEKENKVLHKDLKQQNENKQVTMSGSYAGEVDGKRIELLLTSNGGIVLSTSENNNNECFYGGYTIENNKLKISLITGKNAYNEEVIPNNNIDLIINKGNTITYKENDTDIKITLETKALKDFQNIGKIFKITTN